MSDHVLVWDLLWADVAGYFEPDGSLLDVCVFDVNNSDWQLVLDAVRSQAWRLECTHDGSARPLPHDVGARKPNGTPNAKLRRNRGKTRSSLIGST